MEIRIRESGQVMYESEFRALFPNTSLPLLTEIVLNDLGADVVLEAPQAQPTRYQIAFRDGVAQVDGKWFTKYSVSDLDADGIAAKDAEQAKSVRATRNSLIAECDWTQLADVVLTDEAKLAWATYRQELRDITAQEGFPFDVTYPTKP
jgi:hypothetical protein